MDLLGLAVFAAEDHHREPEHVVRDDRRGPRVRNVHGGDEGELRELRPDVGVWGELQELRDQLAADL